ncbi:MAG: tetratricopeptide repeat protein, partial [Chloroflexota bacterium]
EKLTLKIASVIGTNFQRSLLSEIHPLSDAQLLVPAQLEKLEQAQLIQLESADPEWEYMFRNVIMQEVVYEGLLLAQRRQLHAIVASALEAVIPDEVERLAFHYSRSDNWDKALHYLNLAVQKARKEYANQAAIQQHSLILDCLVNLSSADKTKPVISTEYWDHLMERAKLYGLLGRRDEEIDDLGTLGIMAEALDDTQRRALAAKQWAYLYETSGDYISSLEMIERSVQLAQSVGDEALIGDGYNYWGKLLYLYGEYETAHTYLQQSLQLAQQLQDKRAQADSLNSLGLVAHYQADYDVALYFFNEAIELWQAIGDQVGFGTSLCNRGRVRYDLGEYGLTQTLYQEALMVHRKIGDRAGEAFVHHNLGQLQRTLGNYETAQSYFQAALAFFNSIGDSRRKAHTLAHLGFLYIRLETYETARLYLKDALDLFRELHDPWTLGKALIYYGWMLIDLDKLDEAKSYFEESLAIGNDLDQEPMKIENLVNLAHIALTQQDEEAVQTYIEPILAFIKKKGIAGIEHPAKVYLTLYQLLQDTEQSDQAQTILQEGQQYLSSRVTDLDPSLRQSYLTLIP